MTWNVKSKFSGITQKPLYIVAPVYISIVPFLLLMTWKTSSQLWNFLGLKHHCVWSPGLNMMVIVIEFHKNSHFKVCISFNKTIWHQIYPSNGRLGKKKMWNICNKMSKRLLQSLKTLDLYNVGLWFKPQIVF